MGHLVSEDSDISNLIIYAIDSVFYVSCYLPYILIMFYAVYMSPLPAL
jgi:hypothetical protein